MSQSVYELARENPSSKSLDATPSVIAKKSSIINCRICLSNILEPASLSCGHKFCEKCLEGYWVSKDRPDVLICPLCRHSDCTLLFTKQKLSSNDFRKDLNSLEEITEEHRDHRGAVPFIRFSILFPALYYILKYIISELMSFLQIDTGFRGL